METIGEKIYRLRKQAGFSQEELGYRIGVSRQAVSQWEKDALIPKTDKIKALCDVFNVNADYFLQNEESKATDDAQAYGLGAESSKKNDKLTKKTKILVAVMALIMVLVVAVAVVLICLVTYEKRGDYTVSSITFGLTQNGMVVLISVIAGILILTSAFMIVHLIKKSKK